MTWTVKWRGVYSEEFPTRAAAERAADLIVATAGNWTPKQRQFHPQVVILNAAGSEVDSRSVADEMARLKAQGSAPQEGLLADGSSGV